ncbi:MAG: protein translocase subunit SecD [Planctomycetes bacterium]|nr:protein translocase subunit SecD [Planctomycetota bacterium]
MFQNVQWKLLTVILIIAVAVVISFLGFPGNKGFLGLNLRFGTDLRGGSRLVYTLQNVEVEQKNSEIQGYKNSLQNSLEVLSEDYPEVYEEIGANAQNIERVINRLDHGQLDDLENYLNMQANELESSTDKELIDSFERAVESVKDLSRLKQDLKRILNDFEKDKKESVNKVCDVLRNRLDASKLGGIVVRPYGEDRVQIILPEAIRNEENIKKIIKSSGQLFWRMEAPNKYKGKVTYPDFPVDSKAGEYRWYPIQKDGSSAGDSYKVQEEWDTVYTQKYVLIAWKPSDSKVHVDFLSGDHLASIKAATGSDMGKQVAFEFKEKDKNKFGTFTEQYKKQNYSPESDAPRLCVIFNEKVFWAGTIDGRIPGRGVMSGFQDAIEQNSMINLLSAGSLPVTLVEEGDSTTGAELGQNSIRQGVIAIIIGGAVVLIFIMFYYLGAGLIANFAVISNLFLLLGIMVLFQATMTLPGIAGIILTIGMSIDANILIFERIREEKRKTGNLKDAIQRGFDRAIVTILDAQITTILTAFILALVGTAEIQGFAITLIIGISASLFTSLLVTRFLIGFLVSVKAIKKFSMLQMIGSPKFNFLKLRAPMFSLSTILIIIGLVIFSVRGTENLGIDFLGGMEFHVVTEESADVDDVRKGFAELKDEQDAPKYPDIRIIAAYPEGVISSGSHTSQFVITFPSKKADESTDLELRREVDKRNKKNDIDRVFNGDTLPRLVQPAIDAYVGKSDTVQFKITVPFSNQLTGAEMEFIKTELPIYLEDEVKISDDKYIYEVIEENFAANDAITDETQEKLPIPRFEFRNVDNELLVYLMDMPVRFGTFDKIITNAEGEKSGTIVADEFRRVIKEFVSENDKDIQNKLSDRIIDVKSFPHKGKLLVSFNVEPAFGKDEFRDEHLDNLVSVLKKAFEDLQGFNHVNIDAKEVTKAERESGLLMDNKYFDILGVKRATNAEEIEKAFKLKKKEFSTNPDKLAQLNTAYGTLTNEELRLNYENKLVGFVIEVGDDTMFADMTDDDVSIMTNPENMVISIEKEVHLFLNPKNASDRGEGYTPRSVPSPFLRQEVIGQTIASDMQEQATWAIIISLLVIIIYIWVRFRNFKYGLGATMALAHDVMFALGAIAVFDALDIVNVKIDLTVIAALLTIIGYSLNDTIVVFDRVRENLVGTKKNIDIKPHLNTAVNQTLSRTILTSFTTFVVVFVLLLLGTQVLEGFAFTLFIGVLVGTYSSIFIATPILTARWEKAKSLILTASIAGFILGGVVFWVPAMNILPHIGEAPFLSMVLYSVVFIGLAIWGYSWYDFVKTSVSPHKTDKTGKKKPEKKTDSFVKKEDEPYIAKETDENADKETVKPVEDENLAEETAEKSVKPEVKEEKSEEKADVKIEEKPEKTDEPEKPEKKAQPKKQPQKQGGQKKTGAKKGGAKGKKGGAKGKGKGKGKSKGKGKKK